MISRKIFVFLGYINLAVFLAMCGLAILELIITTILPHNAFSDFLLGDAYAYILMITIISGAGLFAFKDSIK